MRLAIVTASTDLERARPCIESWIQYAQETPAIFLILNSGPKPTLVNLSAPVAWLHREEYLGSVRAFQTGVDVALESPAEIIACLHDDFEIQEPGWDQKVLKYFARNSAMGLAGFGGAIGLGALDMYEKPYDPMSLARVGFRSDLIDAEHHGIRSVLAEQVACLDGFSQIGRREFWEGQTISRGPLGDRTARRLSTQDPSQRPWAVLHDLGIRHHLYDGLLGALAARYGWETWYLPLRGRHWGGRTAVGDAGYQRWAMLQQPGGDQGFWEEAHRIGYEQFRDVLPLRV